MKLTKSIRIEWFLRIALCAGFLSAVADRFGLWKKEISVWGNWDNFLEYTQTLNPFIPNAFIPFIGATATFLEVLFAIGLLLNYKTTLVAQSSGILLLLFGVAMIFSINIKAPLDFSVFAASAAAFSLSLILSSKNKTE